MNFFKQTNSESPPRNTPKRQTELKIWKSTWFISTILVALFVIAPLTSADSTFIDGAIPSQEGEGGEGETPPEGEEAETPPEESADPIPETPAEGEEAPATEGEEAPATEGEEAPATEGEEAPATEGEETPATEGEEAPAAEGEEAPATEGEETPAAEGEEAPATEGEEAPAAEGEEAPAAEGEEAPATEGEETPATEGEEAPATEGEETPATEGEEALATESEEAPAAESEETQTFVLADEAVPFSTTENFVSVTGFETNTWTESTAEGGGIASISIDSTHPSIGNSALRISMPVTAVAADVETDPNTVSWTRTLDQAENWTAYDHITLDVYSEDQLADMPFLQLTLSNSLGNGTTVTMLPGRDLIQWENPGMIIPINSVDDAILSDVTAVTFTAAGYNDGLFGPAQSSLNLHIDNIKLDGSVMWESFETSPYAVEPATVETTLAGITNNTNYAGNPGSLVLSWSGAEEGNGVATITAAEGQDWTGITAVRGWVYASNGELPLTLAITDGTNTVSADAVSTGIADEWAAVVWSLPADAEINLSNISGMTVAVADLATYPEGTIFVDSLEAAVSIDTPYDVKAIAGETSNEISWNNPLAGNATGYTVVAAINDFATSADEGFVVCEVAIDAASVCVHEELEDGAAYYYTVLANTAEGAVFSDTSKAISTAAPFMLTPAGSNFEIAINRDNGAIEAIYNSQTGELISAGNAGGAAWALKFFDEETMPMLTSAEFSADSEAARFNLDEENGILHYFYDMDGDAATTEVHVQIELTQIDNNTFDWNMLVENESGLTVRKVIMPHGMSFEAAGLERVYVPAWEGLTLEQTYFIENRSAHFGRGSMFADMVAIEHDAGNFAFYTIQDSLYQADIIPGHSAEDAVIQPADYHFWGNGGNGYVAMEIGTAIPSGQSWNSATVRFHIDANLDEVMEGYMADTGLDQIPSLAEKAVLYGQFSQIAESALLNLDISAIEAETGQTWQAIRDQTLATLPQNAIVQFSRWQNGGVDAEGNLLSPDINQDLPSAPIWTDQHGSVEDLQALLDTMNAEGIFAAPYLDWTVWTQLVEETGNLPSLENSPDALRSSTASQAVTLDGGYVLKSWSDDLRARNDAIVTQFSSKVTLDMLYSEMSGADRWRYTYLDDASQASASAFTQGLINETNRLGAGQPLIVGSMMDQLASGATGFAGSLRQEQTTGLMRHLGAQYDAWNAYPLAAMMMHDKVAFYPNPTQNARPTASRAEFTYYTLMGYNLAEDAGSLTGGREFWVPMISSFQESINSRTFGEEMVSYEVLTEDGKQIETVFGSGRSKITISANFDLDGTGATADFNGYTVSPDGFHAYTADGSMVGGVYFGQFNGNGLSSGRHWITVEKLDNTIEVRQTFGTDTDVMLNRPRSWRNADLIQMVQVMENGRAIPVEVTDVLPDRILISYANELEGLATDRFIVYYNQLDSGFDLVATVEELTAVVETEAVEEPAETVEDESGTDEAVETPAEGESVEGETENAEGEAVETPTEGESAEGETESAEGDAVETPTEETDGSEAAETPAEGTEESTEGSNEGETAETPAEETEEGSGDGETAETPAEGETPPETADEAPEGDAPPAEGEDSGTDDGSTETEGSAEGETPTEPDPSGADDDGPGGESSGEGEGAEDPTEESGDEAPEGDGN